MTEVFKGATSRTTYFELVDSTTGLPKTGVVFGDVTGSYVRSRGARTAITMATLASAAAAYSSGGFILVDDANQPGVYRLDVPDAAFATGVEEVVVTLKATGCRTVSKGFVLTDWNKQAAKMPATIAAGDLAANSLTASALAADAVAEIQSGLATSAALATVDDFLDTEVAAIKTVVDAVKLKTDELTFTTANLLDVNVLDFGGVTTDVDDDLAAIKAKTDGLTFTTPGVVDASATVSLGANAPAGWINAAAIGADAITAAKIASDAVAEIQSGLATAAALTTIDDFLDTEVAAIKAKTDQLTFTTPNVVDASGGGGGGDAPTVAEIRAELDTNSTKLANLDAAISTRAAASTALTNATWTDAKAAFLDASIAGVSTGGVTPTEIAEAVRDNLDADPLGVDVIKMLGETPEPTDPAVFAEAVRDVSNASPAANSLGAAVNDKAGYSLGAAGLDAIPMTLTAAPSTFREWFVWLTLRFRRTHRNKSTGAISIYGSDGATVVTTQTSTDTSTEETTGVTA